MFFTPILNPNGSEHLSSDLAAVASKLALPVKNVRRWIDSDSIPAEWWEEIASKEIASLEELAAAATARRQSRSKDAA